MQQYLTLEEAAKMLLLSVDQLREMARKKTVRAFQDRGSWRFRLQDVEELARKRGINSDPEVRLGDSKKARDRDEDDEVPLGREKSSQASRSGKTKGPSSPKPGSDSDVRLVLDEDVQLMMDAGGKAEPAPKSGPRSPKGDKRKSKIDSSDSGVRLTGTDEPSDSDVQIIPSDKDSGAKKKAKSHSDSDIRLDDLPSSGKKGRESNIITEEIDLDAEEARLAEKSKKKGKDGGKGRPATMMANKSLLPTQSPFEISEPDLELDKPSGKVPKSKKKPEKDSSSDFELIAFDASKSPIELGSGEIPVLNGNEEVNLGSEVAGGHGGNSGINLDDPADGGISLESGGSDEMTFDLGLDENPAPGGKSSKVDDDSSSEFELSIDDSSSELNIGGPDGDHSSSEFELTVDDSDEEGSSEFELSLEGSDESAVLSSEPNSDSEFELTLDDDGGLASGDEEGKDIFEDTNFDVPALDDDSGSEAVAIDDADTDLEGSDFEISLDEDSSTDDGAGSEVVSLDENEEADEGAATVARAKKKPLKKGKKNTALVEDDEVSQLDLDINDSAPKPKGKKKPVDDDDDDVDSDGELQRPAAAAVASDWGAFPAILLFPTVMVLFVVGLMGFELVRGMWGYHRPSPVGKPLIDAIARQVDDTLPK